MAMRKQVRRRRRKVIPRHQSHAIALLVTLVLATPAWIAEVSALLTAEGVIYWTTHHTRLLS